MDKAAAFERVLHQVVVPAALVRSSEDFGGTVSGDCLVGDLIVKNGRAAGLMRSEAPAKHVVLPRLIEPHVHLDKCHTVDRIDAVGGDLRAAIAAQGRDQEAWTREDICNRATRGMKELVDAGCRAVRTHVDWTYGADATTPPLAWSVLTELANEWAPDVTLQVAPLVSVDTLADWDVAERIVSEIAKNGAVLGVFVLDQPERAQGIKHAFQLADHFGLMLDFHVDEGLDPRLNGLEMIVDAAHTLGFERPILCGHACSLMSQSKSVLDRLMAKLREAPITICALPTTNLYLQGRTDGTPERRGLTRLRELQIAGVPTVIGTDNVRDAFCPIGRHDPRTALAQAVLAAHLDPPFGPMMRMITTDAASAIGLDPITVDGAAMDDLLVFEASSLAQVLSDAASPRRLAHVLNGEMV